MGTPEGGRLGWTGRERVCPVGSTWGRLTVINILPAVKSRGMRHVRCSCGTEKGVSTRNLQSGHTVSCGCYRYEKGLYRRLAPTPGVHPLVAELFALMRLHRVSIQALAKLSGVSASVIKNWRKLTPNARRYMPDLVNLEACLTVMGKELTTKDVNHDFKSRLHGAMRRIH